MLGGLAGAGDLDVIPAPSGPRPRLSYVPHAFLDRHLGDAFYALMEEQRSLVFAVWERLGCEEIAGRGHGYEYELRMCGARATE